MARATRDQINFDFTFFTYLHIFYTDNRRRIRAHFRDLSKKFLDFNDPESGAFLREPQFQALEMYVFLKEYLSNRHVHQIFADWHAKESGFEGRSNIGVEQGLLFGDLDTDEYEKTFNYIRKSGSPKLSKLHLRTTDGNRKDNSHGDLYLLRIPTRQQVPKRSNLLP